MTHPVVNFWRTPLTWRLPLNPCYSGLVMLTVFIGCRIFFTVDYFSYALSFGLLFSLLGFMLSRQWLMIVPPVLILGMHYPFIMPLNQTLAEGERISGEAVVVAHTEEASVLFRGVLYADSRDALYLNRITLIPETEKAKDELSRVYLGQKIAFRHALAANSTGRTLKLDSESRVSNATYAERYFSLNNLKAYLSAKAGYYIPESAPIFSAVMLADRRGLSGELKTQATSMGIYHLFALSGLHTGLITGLFYLLVRLLWLPLTVRFTHDSRYFLLPFIPFVMTGFYVWMIGWNVTAVRAWVMIGFWLVTRQWTGYLKSYVSLMHIACWMLCITPALLFSTGFLLSFMSVAALLLCIPEHRQSVSWAKCYRVPLHFMRRNLIFSSVIFLVTLPLILEISNFLPFAGPINNILHIAYFTLVLLPAGLLAGAAGLLWYGSQPGQLEYTLFWVFDQAVRGWFWLIGQNQPFNDWLLFKTDITLSNWAYAVYYAVILGGAFWLVRRFHRITFVRSRLRLQARFQKKKAELNRQAVYRVDP